MASATWKGDDLFLKSLDQFVLQPFTQPNVFDKKLNPMRRLVLVHGRPGVGKKEAIESYCDKIGLPNGVIAVDFGRTSEAVTKIQSVIANQNENAKKIEQAIKVEFATSSAEEEEENRINHAIIVDRFDKLVFEPDNETTMLFMLNLSEVAKVNKLMFICLSDRLLAEEMHPNLPLTTRLYRQGVFEQFSAKTYLPPPHSLFRKAFFKETFDQFVAHANATSPYPIKLDLTEGDYTVLADESAYATTEDMWSFLRAIFYDMVSPDPHPLCRPADAPRSAEDGKPTGPMTLNMVVLDKYITTRSGTRHILPYDPRAIESKYSEASGRGPIIGMKSNRPEPLQKPQLEPITAFKQELVDLDAAGDELKRKKKRRGGAKRERPEEEDLEAEAWKREGAGMGDAPQATANAAVAE